MEMEKPSSVLQGELRLPPGFRFHPTDEELVVQYLRRKAFSFPLPANIIPEIDLCKFDPWDLPGGSERERYFFNAREAKYPNGNRPNRGTCSGYWKATGKDKQIVASRGSQVVGMRKVLVFYRGKPPNGSRTDWVMHEYRLPGAVRIVPSDFRLRESSTHNSMTRVEDWVLCRIFLKIRAIKGDEEMMQSHGNEAGDGGIRFFDFMRRSPSPPPSSDSESSCVTDLSSGGSSCRGEDSVSSRPYRTEEA